MSSVVEIMLKEEKLQDVHSERFKVIATYLYSKAKFPEWINKEELIEKAADKLKPYLSIYFELLFNGPKDEHRIYAIKDWLIEYCEGTGLKGTPWYVACYNLGLINLVDNIKVRRIWLTDYSKPNWVECDYRLTTRLSPNECVNIGNKVKEIAEKNSAQNFACSISKFNRYTITDFTQLYPGIHLWPYKETEILVGVPLNKTGLNILLYLEGMLQSFDLKTGKFEIKKIHNLPIYKTAWK